MRMAVEMIRRYIENRRHIRANLRKCATGQQWVKKFQLKTTQFQHNTIAGDNLIQPVNQRRANVAAHMHRLTAGHQHLPHQCGGRRFATAARNRNHRAETTGLGQLHRQQAVVA